MSVSDGQVANASTFNGAFVSKTSDSVVISKIDLNNTDPASGSAITNIQKKMNDNTTAIDDHVADSVDAHDASAISYDNATSGLSATESQAAIDEIDSNLDSHITETTGAHASSAISYDNGVSGLTAIEVKSAIDELESLVSTAQSTADAAIPSSEKGAVNGVAELDGTGKVPASQLPTNLMQYQGNWDASTNSPTLTSGVGTQGDVYRVSVAGTTNLDGITDWQVGDWAAYNGTAWEKSDNTDQVTSVAGKQGAVTLTAGDIANVPLGNLSSSDVQNALDELQGDIDTLQSKQDPISGTSNEIVVASDIVGIADDPVLPGQGSVTIPKGTTAQRSGTPVDGMFRYNSDDNTFEGYSNSAWGPIGGAGGVGGGLDAFLSENFSSTTSSDFSTGKNATFLGGGTLGGVISDETTSPLEGATSIKYVAGASSQYDYLASPVITLDERQKAHDCGMNFYFTWDGSVDVQVVVWDVTNSQNLLTTLDVVETKSGATRYSASFYPPSSCASIRYGFHFINTPTSGDILIFDCVELSTNPFVYKNLVETNSISLAGNDGRAVTADTESVPFSNVISTSSTGWTSGSDGSTPTNGNYYTVQNNNSSVHIETGIFWSGLAPSSLKLFKNGSEYKRIQATDAANTLLEGSYRSGKGEFAAGDKLAIVSGASVTLLNSNALHYLTIYEQWETEHVVTPAKSGTEYYEMSTGALNFWDSTGDSYTFDISQNPLTDSKYVEWNDTTQTRLVAKENTVVDVAISGVPATNSSVYVYNSSGAVISRQYVAGLADTTVNANVKLAKGDYIYFRQNNGSSRYGGISITARPAEVTFMAAVPTVKTAILKDKQTSGTSGGSTSANTVQTRVLNTIEGDSEIVSLSSNQFTLSSGTYLIKGQAPVYLVDRHQLFLYDIDNTTYIADGESCYTSSAGSDQGLATVSHKLTITNPTTFELRHWTQTAQAGNGLGVASDNHASNPQSNEVYAKVEIQKIR